MSPLPLPSARDRLTGSILAMIGVLCFSVRPVLIKLAYGHGVDPVTLLALRMGLSLPAFAAVAVWTAQRARAQDRPDLTRGDWLRLMALGFFGYYLASFLDFLGLQYVTAGIGRLLLFLYPTMVVAIGWIWLGRKANRREIAALILTYGGVALVAAAAPAGQSTNLPLGTALLLGCALSYAIYLVGSTSMTRKLGSMRFTALATLFACTLCIGQFLLLRPLSALDLPQAVWIQAGLIAVVSTILPGFLTAEALRRAGATQVALMGGLAPIAAAGFGWLLLGESLTGLQALGALLILAGVLAVTLKRKA